MNKNVSSSSFTISNNFSADQGGPGAPPGLQGIPGLPGPQGPQGTTGPQGITGPPGANGTNGIDGTDGAQGPAGPEGPEGPEGPDGPQGPAGGIGEVVGTFGRTPADLPPDGLIPQDWDAVGNPPTAYQMQMNEGLLYTVNDHIHIWVSTVMTPSGWVDAGSLAGPQGPAGPQGTQGPMGPIGPIGPIGVTGATGAQGPTGNDGTDGAPGIQGPIGPIGPTGPEGPAPDTSVFVLKAGDVITGDFSVLGSLTVPTTVTGGPMGPGTINTQGLFINGEPITIANAVLCQFLGDGSDGPLVLNNTNYTATRDMYFSGITISGTGHLYTGGFLIFNDGATDLSNAGFAAITPFPQTAPNATNNNGAAGGLQNTNAGSVDPGNVACSGGGSGSSATPGAGTGVATINIVGGRGGNGGSGGTGFTGGSAGAAGGVVAAPTIMNSIHRLTTNLAIRGVLYTGGQNGGGAGAGGRNASNQPGSGGGGAGAGGGILALFTKSIITSATTAAGAIWAGGINGGTNTAVSTPNCGAGGGAGGSGGGEAYVAYVELIGPPVTNLIDVSGGAGGRGGTATQATGGRGGDGGWGGLILAFNLALDTITTVLGLPGGAGVNGTNAAGTNGGLGGAAGLCQLTL
jgi:hypothetical protein